jgi:hypothetical protein
MNWCLENKQAFLKNFVQYLVTIGFTLEEACGFVSTDPELHQWVMQIRMCFSVGENHIPPTDPKELS